MKVRFTTTETKKAKFTLYPDFISESIKTVDFNYLHERGIKACLIDLDGTVVNRGTFDVDLAIGAALMKSGLKIYIATNRPKSRSLKNLKEDLYATDVIHPKGMYGKPSKRYYLNALKAVGFKQHETVMIGDRYIQDILGANRAGIYSLLVNKLGANHDKIDRFISNKEKDFTQSLLKKYHDIVPK